MSRPSRYRRDIWSKLETKLNTSPRVSHIAIHVLAHRLQLAHRHFDAVEDTVQPTLRLAGEGARARVQAVAVLFNSSLIYHLLFIPLSTDI